MIVAVAQVNAESSQWKVFQLASCSMSAWYRHQIILTSGRLVRKARVEANCTVAVASGRHSCVLRNPVLWLLRAGFIFVAWSPDSLHYRRGSQSVLRAGLIFVAQWHGSQVALVESVARVESPPGTGQPPTSKLVAELVGSSRRLVVRPRQDFEAVGRPVSSPTNTRNGCGPCLSSTQRS
jgi:hypothetical protein